MADEERRAESAPAAKVHFLLLPHTHWDREWYLPFEDFRQRLVTLINHLLDLLDNDPSYGSFHLDGQTIVLLDYEEIKGRSERLRRRLAEGRIKAGPWFVLPDEFLVSGEALIRNLERGFRICREFGTEPVALGYLPDMFGHIAQMPQILTGFGLHEAVVWRGIDPAVTGQKFWWEAPDGTRVFTAFLPLGYGGGTALPADPSLLAERLELLAAAVGVEETNGILLLLNGSDHVEPQAKIAAALNAVCQSHPGWSWEFGDWAKWMEVLRNSPGPTVVHRGELRSSSRTLILPSVASARLYLKQMDFKLSSSLEHYAEPLAALARTLAGLDLTGALDYAWGLVLQNHPHDSICGCSVDAVHAEMETRGHKAQEVADRVVNQSLAAIFQQMGGGTPLVSIYNPGPAQSPAVVMGEIEGRLKPGLALVDEKGEMAELQLLRTISREKTILDFELPRAGALMILRDLLAAEQFGLYVQAVEMQTKNDLLDLRLDLGSSPSPLDIEAVRQEAERKLRQPAIQRVCFRLKRLPRHQAAFLLPRLESASLISCELKKLKSHSPSRLTIASNRMENDLVSLQFEPGGTCLLTDKTTGIAYRCLRFLDVGDRGDTYNFDPLPDEPILGEMDKVALKSVAVGPVAAVMEIRHRLRLPRSLHASRQNRSRKHVTIDLTTTVTLYADLARVDFHTSFVNTASDHRLQTAVQVPFESESITVETPFALVDRPVVDMKPAPPPRPGDLSALLLGTEGVYPTSPHKTLALIKHNGAGLALMNRGLAELEVRRLKGGTWLALTMVRSVGWLSRGDLVMRRGDAGPMLPAEGAQCQRPFGWDYAVMPFSSGLSEGQLLAAAHAFAYPPRLDLILSPGGGSRGFQLLHLDNPEIVLSALRPLPGAGIEIRLVNPSRTPTRCRLQWGLWWEEVMVTDMKGEPVSAAGVKLSPEGMEAEFRPGQILTLRLREKKEKSSSVSGPSLRGREESGG